MPEYQVDFTIEISHNNGTIKVEAETPEEAVRIVHEDLDVDVLMDHCSGEETYVDAWIPGEDEEGAGDE